MQWGTVGDSLRENLKVYQKTVCLQRTKGPEVTLQAGEGGEGGRAGDIKVASGARQG